jgi:splicing suppressor protein 51
MRPLSQYTCQGCLLALRSSPRASRRAVFSTQLNAAQRYISNGSGVSPRDVDTTQIMAQAFQKISSRRAISSYGQTVKTDPSEYQSPPRFQSNRSIESEERTLLKPNNLFHPLSNSPSPDMRRRAAFIKQNAFCPHPDHRQTRLPTNPADPEARKSATASLPPKHVSFECPDCGIPVSCSEEHWAHDYESHLEICDTLREINEDDHDLRSGRFFPEFEYPGPQIEEAMVNMTNWDTFLYSREFEAINDERSLRQATRLLTYPVTIGSVLHELSPYNYKTGGRLTVEGLKSLSGMLLQ